MLLKPIFENIISKLFRYIRCTIPHYFSAGTILKSIRKVVQERSSGENSVRTSLASHEFLKTLVG